MKKRKGVTIKINFTNRWLYSLIAIGIFVIISAGVYAWANSAGVGHSYDELQPCSGTQILKMNGAGAWACADDAVGGHGNGANCPAGQYPLGVDANGAVESCTADATLSRSIPLYTIHARCTGAGGLTTASTCPSALCGTNTYYYCATGSCSRFSAETCSNTLRGYLVN